MIAWASVVSCLLGDSNVGIINLKKTMATKSNTPQIAGWCEELSLPHFSLSLSWNVFRYFCLISEAIKATFYSTPLWKRAKELELGTRSIKLIVGFYCLVFSVKSTRSISRSEQAKERCVWNMYQRIKKSIKRSRLSHDDILMRWHDAFEWLDQQTAEVARIKAGNREINRENLPRRRQEVSYYTKITHHIHNKLKLARSKQVKEQKAREMRFFNWMLLAGSKAKQSKASQRKKWHVSWMRMWTKQRYYAKLASAPPLILSRVCCSFNELVSRCSFYETHSCFLRFNGDCAGDSS